MPWKPQLEGDFPTLGWSVLDWMTENLAQPGRIDYEPFVPSQEQADFALKYYRLNPKTGRRVIRRGVISRSRGWGKSPFLGALGIAEGLADVVPDGWDAEGQPVGKPWSSMLTPWIVFAAVTEDQTANAWEPLGEMLRSEAPVYDSYPGLEPMGSQINLPAGWILPITSSPDSIKGKPTVWTAMDQTEQWTTGNKGKKLFKVLRGNAMKVGGSFIEAPNAFTPGEGSVAEDSAKTFFAIKEGRSKNTDGILYDHREAPGDTQVMDRGSLLNGLRIAYGDSSAHPDGCVIHDPPCDPGWVDLEALIDGIWDEDMDEQDARADFLNQITHSSDAWISQFEWRGCESEVPRLQRGDVVTLGFDGSLGKAKGKPDATALVAVRVSDGYAQVLGLWEASDDKNTWESWQPPLPEIEAAVKQAFTDYKVAGFFADPGKDWRSHVNSWEGRYGRKVTVKARRDHPFEWWMTGGRSAMVEKAVEATESAVRLGELKHRGDLGLTRHILNAKRRLNGRHLALGKSSASSPHKIDAAVSLVLAWAARQEAISAGLAAPRKPSVPKRIR